MSMPLRVIVTQDLQQNMVYDEARCERVLQNTMLYIKASTYVFMKRSRMFIMGYCKQKSENDVRDLCKTIYRHSV